MEKYSLNILIPDLEILGIQLIRSIKKLKENKNLHKLEKRGDNDSSWKQLGSFLEVHDFRFGVGKLREKWKKDWGEDGARSFSKRKEKEMVIQGVWEEQQEERKKKLKRKEERRREGRQGGENIIKGWSSLLKIIFIPRFNYAWTTHIRKEGFCKI